MEDPILAFDNGGFVGEVFGNDVLEGDPRVLVEASLSWLDDNVNDREVIFLGELEASIVDLPVLLLPFLKVLDVLFHPQIGLVIVTFLHLSLGSGFFLDHKQ